jgi:ribonucleoside-diphosphate reductase beta chain
MKMDCVNWNKTEDYVNTFWNQNIMQFWTDSEFPIDDDKGDWADLPEGERTVFKHVLAGLTGLDTKQASEGMPLLALHTDDYRKKAVLSFMGMMEHIHAKSYSSIFTTLLTSEDTDYLLETWAPNQSNLVYKSEVIGRYYRKLLDQNAPLYDVYMACVASVFLESFLFYSGFYYPLYLSGQGKMRASGEVVRKILLDENIHGLYVGQRAQEINAQLSPEERVQAEQETAELLRILYDNEAEYTAELYDGIGLTDDVLRYVRYNANKALMNLGLDTVYPQESFSAIVENGIDTGTKQHDFFSQKGDGYVIPLNIEPMTDSDFVFA